MALDIDGLHFKMQLFREVDWSIVSERLDKSGG